MKGRWQSRWSLVGLALLLLAGCDLPTDPQGTSRRAANGTILVGVIESRPWAWLVGGEGRGVEAELIGEFAKSINARIEWIAGGESRLMQALGNYQLDLVIGGIEDGTAWRDRVGISMPYFRSATVLAAPAGENPPPDLHGQPVAIGEGDPAREKLHRLGTVPVPAGRGEAKLSAVEDWQIPVRGLTPTGTTLRTARHVIAAPPGENGWILRLDRFLNSQRAEIAGRLQRQAGS